MFDRPLIFTCITFALFVSLAWLVFQKRKTEYTWLQFMLWVIANGLTRFLWRATYEDLPPEVLKSGAVIVSNHHSGVDPLFLQVLCKRPIRWMVAKEYCDHPAFGWILRMCEVISVTRSGIDTAATKSAIRHVENGGLLGMFPEGRLNMTEDFMLPVRPGAVWVAIRSGTPLLPCYIEGSPTRGTALSSFFMKAKVRVRFGELIAVDKHSRVEHSDKLTREIMTNVLLEIARLAGRDDYRPQFAGRKWRPSEETVRAHVAAKRQRDLSKPRES